MTEETEMLLLDVTRRLETAIVARECPAVVALAGDRALVFSDYDYLRSTDAAAAFELRVAAQARTIRVRRWVFAVPQVWVISDESIATRAVSNHPLRPGEHEAITWMSYDVTDGLDYGRVPYVRRPDGTPVFADAERLTVGVTPERAMPGFTLLRALTEPDS